MKENQLRIGNYILYQNQKECKVSSIGSNGFETEYIGKSQPNGSNDLREYQPIPLTEEWLEKFGFEYDSNSDLYCKSHFDVQLLENGVEFYLPSYGNHYRWLEYVHELQNIYFALTGEELTIKSNELNKNTL